MMRIEKSPKTYGSDKICFPMRFLFSIFFKAGTFYMTFVRNALAGMLALLRHIPAKSLEDCRDLCAGGAF